MQTLRRNQTQFHYKEYVSTTPIINGDGYDTGQVTTTYGNLTAGKAYISASNGVANEDMFGKDLIYDKVMIMKNCPFTEYAILWIDAATTGEYDYKVVKIAKSLNSVQVAIRKVTKNGN